MLQVAPGVRRLPLRAPTLPPATHTNAVVVGEDEVAVFDPASPYADEQERLARALDEVVVTQIVLSHHHVDHIGGVCDLAARTGAPIAAHPATAALVAGHGIVIDQLIEDGDQLPCGVVALHTPGHAAGHLVFEAPGGVMIAGDLVAAVGTILIDPVEGDLGHYLASLERVQARAPRVLIPAHGDPLLEAEAVLAFYIAHRHQRSEQIRVALDTHGAASPEELVGAVYGDSIPPAVHGIAARQILAHLLWMAQHGVVHASGARWRS